MKCSVVVITETVMVVVAWGQVWGSGVRCVTTLEAQKGGAFEGAARILDAA